MTGYAIFANGLLCAINVLFYALYQEPWSLGAIVLTGITVVWLLILEAKRP